MFFLSFISGCNSVCAMPENRFFISNKMVLSWLLFDFHYEVTVELDNKYSLITTLFFFQ